MPLIRVIPMIYSLKCRVAFSGRKPAGQRLRSLGYAFSLCVVSYVTLLANCGLPALAELPQNDIVHREEFVDVMITIPTSVVLASSPAVFCRAMLQAK